MIIAPGTASPSFTLKQGDGGKFTETDLTGKTTVLVFFPFVFSGVCTDQIEMYDKALGDFEAAADGELAVYGVSTDATHSQTAWKKHLGISIDFLSDFEPKGETARKLGAYFEPAGMTNRALVITGPDGVVKWSWIGDSPGDLPGPDLIVEGLRS